MAATGRPIVMLAAEVVGYSRLIRADEKGTLEQLETHRDQFVYPKITEHSGRIVRATGDCLLVEFESPIDAVQCAVELQRGMVDRNLRTLPDQRITFRFGVSADQVTANGNDLVSRAVAALPGNILATLIKPGTEFYRERGNLAVRLAGLAEPAGICISDAVQDAIRDRLPYMFADIGKQNLGNRRSTGALLCRERGLYGIQPASHGAKPAEPIYEVANCRRRSERVCHTWRLWHGIVGVARRKFAEDGYPSDSDCGLARALCRRHRERCCPCVVAAIPGHEQHGRRH